MRSSPQKLSSSTAAATSRRQAWWPPTRTTPSWWPSSPIPTPRSRPTRLSSRPRPPGSITVDGVLVVRADANGQIVIQKVTDHSTKTGLKWGIVGGVVLGVLFPPSIIASAAALGVTGGVLGKLRQEHHKSELGAALTGSLAPNMSGILVLATLPAVPEVKETMPKATKVTEVPVDNETADAITEASKTAAA